MTYATSKYLIYCCFETRASVSRSESKIGGSVLLDYAFTEEEATEKVEMYRVRAEVSTYKNNDTSRYCYITNRSEWWRQ